MPLDVTLMGVQMPTLLLVFSGMAVLHILLDKLMAESGIYTYVWHPGLFRTAVFIIMFSTVCLFIY
ncbi:DUF1656 domain-containing protein [Sulfurimonas sp. HSL3-2]|uniref:DUF1656 domain-containing protein n=1 Tax=Hydrocurvibacter mobilis TaxID=3131936 RepID=UPI0031F73369